ncbi:MAG: cupin-like domain-containing protein [Cyanothece sp. SIO1E1]|nr:cupin-like domain-containing protein [Cyanothece sp. SIO1E1]
MQTSKLDCLELEPQNSKNAYPIHSVPREQASKLDYKLFFETYQKPGHPVVVTGALNDAIDWDLNYLCQQIGDQTFLIRQFGRERYQQDKRQWQSIGSGVESISMTFAEYAAVMQSGQAYEQDLYLAKSPFTHTALAQNANLQQIPAVLPLRGPVTDWYLWVGPGGHTTCLHYDPFDGTLLQLHGTKRLVLFPPSQLYNVYPFPLLNHLRYGPKLRASYSQFYPDRPDYEAFPKIRQAQAHRYEVILNPGDLMFIPAGWWHEISTVGTGMVCSVNRFWHVYPWSRALRLWSKWRIHLASVLAAPAMMASLFKAMTSPDKSNRLGQLLQRL